ncbi:MAG: YciI family protein [Actinomycetota bacterium]
MKYALLIYADQSEGPAEGTPEFGAEMEGWFAYTTQLTEAGAMLGGEGLLGAETSTSVQVRDGKTITRDGPFAETKEVLGGFYIVDVDNLDAAIEWASKIPNVGYGTVEVRPVMEVPDQG